MFLIEERDCALETGLSEVTKSECGRQRFQCAKPFSVLLKAKIDV